MHRNHPHMERSAGEQASLCPSYGENLQSANNGAHSQHVAASRHTWKGLLVLKRSFYHSAFVIIIFTPVFLFFSACRAHGGNSLNQDAFIVCGHVRMCRLSAEGTRPRPMRHPGLLLPWLLWNSRSCWEDYTQTVRVCVCVQERACGSGGCKEVKCRFSAFIYELKWLQRYSVISPQIFHFFSPDSR